MNWEELTAKDFPQAVKRSRGVCVLPLGVMEKHGDHLPVGTDEIVIRGICQRAAEKEPVVVFPAYYFTQIAEAKHTPGTVALESRLMWDLLEAVCGEIHRNGFSKILIVNGHGGNNAFLPHFAIASLGRARQYTLYLAPLLKEFLRVAGDIFKRPEDGHGGRGETSLVMALRPQLVKMRDYKQPALALNRLAHLKDVQTPMFWYADFPDHFAGDPALAAPEKGRRIIDGVAASLAQIIRTVKADKVTPRLQKEYYRKVLAGPKSDA